MAGDDNVTAKAMRAPDPEEFLAQMREDFQNQAERLDQEAFAAQEAMLYAQARCAAMRAAANGLGEAIETFQAHAAKAKEARSMRDDREVPSKSGYSVKIPQEYR